MLTQAECIFGRTPSTLNVVVGTVLLLSGGIAHAVSNVVAHPEFNLEWFFYE